MSTHKTFKSFAKALQKHVGDNVKKSAVTAINKSLASTKTQAVKTAAELSGAKQKDIRLRVGVFKASNKNPKGAMVSFSKPVPVSIFNPKTKVVKSTRGKRKGVTIKGPDGRQIVPAASMATYKSGKISVFTRLIGGAIKNLYTDILYKILGRPATQKSLQQKAVDSFEKNFEHELKRNNQI